MKLDDALEEIEDVNPQSPNKRIPLLFNDAQIRFLSDPSPIMAMLVTHSLTH